MIGTVKGDIHDIGKNLVGMMLEGAGFEVIDLGINTDVDEYLAALEEHKPDILGMSALLTTTMPYMKVVIDTMVERGLRDEFIILVGGAPLNEEFGGRSAPMRTAAMPPSPPRRVGQGRRKARPDRPAHGDRPHAAGADPGLRRVGHRDPRHHPTHRLGNVTLECLPGILHNRPTEIPDAVRLVSTGPAELRPHPPRVRRLRHGR